MTRSTKESPQKSPKKTESAKKMPAAKATPTPKTTSASKATTVSKAKPTPKTTPVPKETTVPKAKSAPSVSKKSVLKNASASEEPAVSSKTTVSKRKTTAKTEPVKEINEPEKPAKKTRIKKVQATDDSSPEIEISAEPKKTVKKVSKKSSKPSDEPISADELEEEIPVKKPRKNAKKKAEEVEEINDENIDIEEKVFSLIKKNVGGIYQNEIWKKTNIDSRKCSRILKKLLDADLIIREEAVVSGTKTYLLKTTAEEKKRNYNMLMVKNEFSPCTGCFGECRPEYCPALTFWIMNISENPETLRAAMGYNPTEAESREIEIRPEFIEEMGTEEEMPDLEEIEYE
jgi:Transcriptional regulators